MRIFVDSVVIVYFLDHVGPFQVRAASRLAALRAAGDEIVVSDLIRLECRIDPIRQGDAARLRRMDGFFGLADVRLAAITTAVFDRATQIRAAHRFKTVDSINLATAVEGGCSRFLTNDLQLLRFRDIPVEILP